MNLLCIREWTSEFHFHNQSMFTDKQHHRTCSALDVIPRITVSGDDSLHLGGAPPKVRIPATNDSMYLNLVPYKSLSAIQLLGYLFG